MAATPQQPAAPPQTDRGTQGQWAVGECVGEQACLCLCLSGRPWPSLDYSLGLSASCEGEARERGDGAGLFPTSAEFSGAEAERLVQGRGPAAKREVRQTNVLNLTHGQQSKGWLRGHVRLCRSCFETQSLGFPTCQMGIT